MPGHVKLGKAGEPDPDPAPYLIVSLEMKREDMLKPYDPKKSVWVPTDDHGFREGLLESDDGTKAVVMCGHEVKQDKAKNTKSFCVRVFSQLAILPANIL
jgi:hypothetical protein